MIEAFAPFKTFNLKESSLGTQLFEQLKTLRNADRESARFLKEQNHTVFGGIISAMLMPVWWIAFQSYAASHPYWSFWGWWGKYGMYSAIGWFTSFLVLLMFHDDNPVVNSIQEKMLLVITCGTILAVLFPILPLASLVLCVCLLIWSKAGTSAGGITNEQVNADNRANEYRSFLSHIEAWNDCAAFLNRLRLKIEHRQIPEDLVPQALAGLEAMRAEERLLMDRLSYMQALAQEGALGSQTARAQLSDVLVHNLAEPVHRMRRQLNDLRELDAKAIAALQVQTGTF